MTKHLTKKEVLELLSTSHQDVVEFSYAGDKFYRNAKVRDYLNKLLSADIKSVFTESKKYDTTHSLDWSGEVLILVNAKNEVITMSNSEWANIGKL